MKRRKSPYLQALEGATTATKISKKWDPASATKGKKAQLTLGFFFYIIYNIHHKKNIPIVGAIALDNRILKILLIHLGQYLTIVPICGLDTVLHSTIP